MQKSTPEVFLVNPPDLVGLWPRIAEIFHEHPGLNEQFDLSELMILLLNNNCYQLWVGVDKNEIEGMLLTALVKYNKCNKMHIVGICGENLFTKYIEIGLTKLEQYSCLMGCDEVIFDGRDEWLKPMKKFGYRQTLQMRKSVRQLLAN